jgi:hypothetical protein
MNAQVPIRRQVRLSDLVDSGYITKKRHFEYAGIDGSAETIGWKVVCFKACGSTALDAVRFFGIEQEKEIRMCNLILQQLGFPLSFDSDPEAIFRIFGTACEQEDTLEGITRYHFLYSEDCRVSFDCSGNRITGMEIICSRKLLHNLT